MTKILKTTNYGMFGRIEGNRLKSQAQINKLVASFKENPDLFSATPIIVNDKFEVIDGQHRLAAAEILGQPIYYFVAEGLGLPDIQKLNSSTKSWTPVDYALSFSEKGNQHYQAYLDFKKKYHLTHEILVAYLAIDNGATPNVFRAGKFKAEDLPKSHDLCSKLIEIQEFHKKGDSKKFAFAVKEMLLHPEYEHDKFMMKVKLYGDKFFKDAATAQDYMRQLEALYNYHSKGKLFKLF